MLEFTRALYELFVKQELPLCQCLLIMRSKPKNDYVKKAAARIYMALEQGSLFSNALKSCGLVLFDEVYISFVNIAEKNGDLKTALTYLKGKLEREADCRKKLAEAFIYPLFVVLLSVAASVFIGLYTQSTEWPLLIKYLFGLISVCLLLYFSIAKALAEDRLFEAFTAVDFLLSNGIELSEAVGCAVQIAGPSSRIGKIFENARLKLSYGMDLQNAFLCADGYEGLADSRLREAFYYADAGGCKNDLFGKMAAHLKSQKDRSRTVCLSLIEPLFIVVTGVFILALLMTFFMPVINGIGWI